MAKYEETARAIGYALAQCQDDIDGKDLKKLTITVWFNERTGEPRGEIEVAPVRNVAAERQAAQRDRDFESERRVHDARLSSASRVDSIPQRMAAVEAKRS